MAVRSGYLLLPAVRLKGAAAVHVDRGKQVAVFPQPHRPLVEIVPHVKSSPLM
jgi:hypothetical protein